MPMYDIERSGKIHIENSKTDQEVLLRARDIGDVTGYGNEAIKSSPAKKGIVARMGNFAMENIVKTIITTIVGLVATWYFIHFLPSFG